MQRISVYIPDNTKKRIRITARAKNEDESEIIRQALNKGLEVIHPQSASARALLELAEMGEKLPDNPDTPKDVSANLDYYAWGGLKKND